MSEPVLRVGEGGFIVFRCPGCGDLHALNQPGTTARWEWNGDVAHPTITPSIMVRSGHYVPSHGAGDNCWCDFNREHPDQAVSPGCYACHSFVREGQIQFLGDCTHALAGQTVPLPPWKEAS